MILPLQENQNDSAKYLILLGSRVQKPGKTGFGVELERPRPKHHRPLSAGLPEPGISEKVKEHQRFAHGEWQRRHAGSVKGAIAFGNLINITSKSNLTCDYVLRSHEGIS